MMDKTKLLESIRSRKSVRGVLTADRYFREIEGCFNGGFCPVTLFGSKSPEEWVESLKSAESRLTLAGGKINQKTIVESDVPGEGIMSFDCTVTTPRRDRDKDVLVTAGFTLDAKAPLLWQHISMQPIGAQLSQKKTPERILAKFVIADIPLGRDAAKLIKLGALRISHGFEPEEYEPMDDEEGWKFLKGLVYEVSVVSVPSNTDAVIHGYSEKSFESPLVMGWAKKAFDARPVVVPVALELKTPCSCKDKKTVTKDAYGDVTGSYEDLRSQLHDDIARYFASIGEALDRDEWAYIHSTFADSCIVCVQEGYGDGEHYRISWQLTDGKPTLYGEAVEVELRLTAEAKARHALLHKGHRDEPKETPFEDLRKEVVVRSFFEPVEKLKETVLSLQGVIDQALAQREELAWQRTLTELGIE